MVFLGDRDIALHRDHVALVPKRLHVWLGHQEVNVAYAAIANTLLVKPPLLARGQWTIRLHDGTELAVGFPKRATLRMESIHQEVLVGALAAQFSRA